jgi:hypothetical protein
VLLDSAAQLLAVLQGARRMEGEFLGASIFQQGRQGGHQVGQQFTQVAGEFADALGFRGIGRVMRQGVAVFFDGHTAAGGIHHDGFDAAAFNMRPPGVNVAAHV